MVNGRRKSATIDIDQCEGVMHLVDNSTCARNDGIGTPEISMNLRWYIRNVRLELSAQVCDARASRMASVCDCGTHD